MLESAMSGDAERRLDRALVFYKDDVDRIDRALEAYQRDCRSQCNLLVDLDGHLVTVVGALEGADVTTVAALVAGSFAATREIARALGEAEFTSLSHHGKDESIQITLVGERTILATVYSPRQTSAGLVVFYLKSAAAALRAALDEVRSRTGARAFEPGFAGDIRGALGEFFGDDA
jgi:predicted regulator of Ras-like GTPase activity (Roadblock/LC7/MglB family)